jgi:hypothetical protein
VFRHPMRQALRLWAVKNLGTSENLSRGPGIQSLTSNCDLRRFYVAGLVGKDGPKSFSERLVAKGL